MYQGEKQAKIKLIFLVLYKKMKNGVMGCSRPFAQKKERIIDLGKNQLTLTLLFKSAKMKKAFTKEKRKGRPIAGKLIKRPHLNFLLDSTRKDRKGQAVGLDKK